MTNVEFDTLFTEYKKNIRMQTLNVRMTGSSINSNLSLANVGVLRDWFLQLQEDNVSTVTMYRLVVRHLYEWRLSDSDYEYDLYDNATLNGRIILYLFELIGDGITTLSNTNSKVVRKANISTKDARSFQNILHGLIDDNDNKNVIAEILEEEFLYYVSTQSDEWVFLNVYLYSILEGLPNHMLHNANFKKISEVLSTKRLCIGTNSALTDMVYYPFSRLVTLDTIPSCIEKRLLEFINTDIDKALVVFQLLKGVQGNSSSREADLSITQNGIVVLISDHKVKDCEPGIIYEILKDKLFSVPTQEMSLRLKFHSTEDENRISTTYDNTFTRESPLYSLFRASSLIQGNVTLCNELNDLVDTITPEIIKSKTLETVFRMNKTIPSYNNSLSFKIFPSLYLSSVMEFVLYGRVSGYRAINEITEGTLLINGIELDIRKSLTLSLVSPIALSKYSSDLLRGENNPYLPANTLDAILENEVLRSNLESTSLLPLIDELRKPIRVLSSYNITLDSDESIKETLLNDSNIQTQLNGMKTIITNYINTVEKIYALHELQKEDVRHKLLTVLNAQDLQTCLLEKPLNTLYDLLSKSRFVFNKETLKILDMKEEYLGGPQKSIDLLNGLTNIKLLSSLTNDEIIEKYNECKTSMGHF